MVQRQETSSLTTLAPWRGNRLCGSCRGQLSGSSAPDNADVVLSSRSFLKTRPSLYVPTKFLTSPTRSHFVNPQWYAILRLGSAVWKRRSKSCSPSRAGTAATCLRIPQCCIRNLKVRRLNLISELLLTNVPTAWSWPMFYCTARITDGVAIRADFALLIPPEDHKRVHPLSAIGLVFVHGSLARLGSNYLHISGVLFGEQCTYLARGCSPICIAYCFMRKKVQALTGNDCYGDSDSGLTNVKVLHMGTRFSTNELYYSCSCVQCLKRLPGSVSQRS